MHRRCHLQLAAHAHHGTREPGCLEAIAGLEIVQHRRFHRVRQPIGKTHLRLDIVVRERNTFCTTYAPGLTYRGLEHGAHVGVGADDPDRLTGRGRHARECYQEAELLP